MKEELVCKYCGSTDVLRDAWVNLNDNEQVISVFDTWYCNNCECETSPISKQEWQQKCLS